MNTANQTSIEKRRASRRKYEQNTDLSPLTVRVHKSRRKNVYIYAMTNKCPNCVDTSNSLKHRNQETRDLKERIDSYLIDIQNLQSLSEMALRQQSKIHFFVFSFFIGIFLIKSYFF